MLDDQARLRLEYEQTSQFMRTLTDIRFRLMAIVPVFAGISVGFFGHPQPAAELLGVGVLGLVATLGIYIDERRNMEVYVAAVARARQLERELGLQSGQLVSHELGLALVYSAALAGWSYLVGWGLMRALEIGGGREIGLAIGAAAGIAVLALARGR
jgi:hypothetical protein